MLFKKNSPEKIVRPPAPIKILVSCAGLGMGNASRISAIIESLTAKAIQSGISIDICVCSWGAGLEFFRQFKNQSSLRFETIELQSYVGNSFLTSYVKNVLKLKQAIQSFSPDFLILDSDYHFFSYFNFKKPIYFIGQAYDVIYRAKKYNYRFTNWLEKINMLAREKLDYLFQTIVADYILVPSFDKNYLPKNKKTKLISLIVRQEFLSHSLSNSSSKRVGILLSGSGIEASHFQHLLALEHISLLSPNQSGSFLSHAESIDKFDIVFTQGGLSSISEVIARKKFLVVFPMKNHPEQSLNALSVEKTGAGIKGNLEELKNFSLYVESVYQCKTLTAGQRLSTDCNGANEAAEIIFKNVTALSQNIMPN